MADAKSAWNEVADSFAGLGERLRRHLDQVAAEGAPERVAVERAMHDLGTAVDHVVNAVGEAVRDPAVRADLTRISASLSGALAATFAEAGIRLRGHGPGDDTGPAGPPPLSPAQRTLPPPPPSDPEAGQGPGEVGISSS